MSPWKDRIELLGNRVDGHVSNASFIRSVASTFIRKWGAAEKIGGLYGATDPEGKERVLRWNRAQQAAFLILIWKSLAEKTKLSKAEWALACRESYKSLTAEQKSNINPHDLDPAFAGQHTLLATDQGVRAILFVYNAVAQCAYEDAGLENWELDIETESTTSDDIIEDTVKDLQAQKTIVAFVDSISRSLVNGKLDWRTSTEPSLNKNNDAALIQAAYRGSGGYTALQKRGLEVAQNADIPYVKAAAIRARALLKYE